MRSIVRGVAAAVAVAGVAAIVPSSPAAAVPPPVTGFDPVIRYSVSGDVAEIVAATPDGRTLVYTDSSAEEIGFVDIATAANPVELGTVPMPGEPTSVGVTRDGRFALATVRGTPDVLVVVDVATRSVDSTYTLPGQPDSIALDATGRYAVIAIENERDEDLNDGEMPQLPAGSLVIVDMIGGPGESTDWTFADVELEGFAARFPEDPEPEFVDIRNGIAAVTLQENNHLVLVDVANAEVIGHFPLGRTTHLADLTDDATVSFTETLLQARREPDAVHWTPGGRLYTANEGDYGVDLAPGQFSGGRNFTLFGDDGRVQYEVGKALEQAAANAGLYPDGRSDNRGVEPEGLEIARFGNRTFLFVGMERANGVAVYRLGAGERPRFVEVLETGDRPEGLLAIPGRRLFVSANEDDGTIDLFRATTG